MDKEAFERVVGLGLCLRCCSLFVNPKNESVLLENKEAIVSSILQTQKLSDEWVSRLSENDVGVCQCCMGFLNSGAIFDIPSFVLSELKDSHNITSNTTVGVALSFSPIVDALRIGLRTVVLQTAAKQGPFPSFTELYHRLVCRQLDRDVNIVSLDQAELKVSVEIGFSDETGLSLAINPSYTRSKRKRLIGGVDLAEDDRYIVTRKDGDNLLFAIRDMADSSVTLNALETRISSYFSPPYDIFRKSFTECPEERTNELERALETGTMLTWRSSITMQPVYLLGRYRKYARDISQAPWTVGSEEDTSNDVDDPEEDSEVAKDSTGTESKQKVRKGRGSVEEILGDAVIARLGATSCRMHPCGREDIDVRMLGNGRPFVVEVLESKLSATPERLASIVSYIKSRQGLNSERDIDLVCLTKVGREVFSSMQAAAEEKNKAYMCVCWSEKKLTRAMLKTLEYMITADGAVDSSGTPCLQITQKTPLRVLHRRSLIPRIRHIYHLDTVLLNEHYFLLNVTTSAGTYVKEFVHGDLGRTKPSVSSILETNADILQLDVVWLFDSFEGNELDDVEDDSAGTESVTWVDMKKLKVCRSRESGSIESP